MAHAKKRTPRKKAVKRKKGRIGMAKPGSTVTRKVTRGPGKGDTVTFKATVGGKNPGELYPIRIVRDVPPLGTQKTIPRGPKSKKKAKPKPRRRKR